MSRRVNATIAGFAPDVEIYSIDETFLSLAGFEGRDLWAMCQDMRATVVRWTGIPNCVGIGPTKTLAKLANAVAKKNPTFGGVCDLTGEAVRAAVLRAFLVGDVWGVGAATAAKLGAVGVTTAAGLRVLSPRQARTLGTVTLERTVMELQGWPWVALEDVVPQPRAWPSPAPSADRSHRWTSCARRWPPMPRGPGKSCGRTAWWPVGSRRSATPAHTATAHNTTASAAPAWCR